MLNPLGDNFTDADFDQVVSDALASADSEFKSRNSWKSILLAGLDVNFEAKRYLAGVIRDLRSGRITFENE